MFFSNTNTNDNDSVIESLLKPYLYLDKTIIQNVNYAAVCAKKFNNESKGVAEKDKNILDNVANAILNKTFEPKDN